MQGQSFVLVPESWLKAIEEKIDLLLQDQRREAQEQVGPVLDAKEAAAYLQVDQNTIYRWVRGNTIPHKRAGKKIFFYKGELDSWMKER